MGLRKSLFVILISFIFILSGCADEDTSTHIRVVKVGAPAPDFISRDLDGRTFRLSEERGSVVVLFFWRLRCDECTSSMDSLDQLARHFRGHKLRVLAVSADSEHSASIYSINKLMKRKGYTFTVLRDSEGLASEALMVLRVPASFIIDRDGKIAFIKDGKIDWMDQEITSLIESLLEGV